MPLRHIFSVFLQADLIYATWKLLYLIIKSSGRAQFLVIEPWIGL